MSELLSKEHQSSMSAEVVPEGAIKIIGAIPDDDRVNGSYGVAKVFTFDSGESIPRGLQNSDLYQEVTLHNMEALEIDVHPAHEPAPVYGRDGGLKNPKKPFEDRIIVLNKDGKASQERFSPEAKSRLEAEGYSFLAT